MVKVAKNSCYGASNCSNVIGVGLGEVITNEEFIIFPNPSNGNINIVNSLTSESYCTIYDVTGKLILDFIVKNSVEKVDLSDLATGVYFIQINGISQKIIVN